MSFHELEVALPADLSVLDCLWMRGRTARRRGWRWRRTLEGRHTMLLRRLCPQLRPAWFFPWLDILIEKPAM